MKRFIYIAFLILLSGAGSADECGTAVVAGTQIAPPDLSAATSWLFYFRGRVQVGVPRTQVRPFNPQSRKRHFERHGSELGLRSEEDYEAAALEFAGLGSASSVSFVYFDSVEKIRKLVIGDLRTNEILFANARTGTLITYFRVDENIVNRLLAKALSIVRE